MSRTPSTNEPDTLVQNVAHGKPPGAVRDPHGQLVARGGAAHPAEGDGKQHAWVGVSAARTSVSGGGRILG